jgi:4-amino-4-deoxy-L-arabinose transferase-like glycosyltransferase
MSLCGRPWFAWLFFGIVILVTRYPHAPGQLFTFDDVNLAYATGHFDVRISQPQPPGYPLFVLQMRVLRLFRFRRAESILLALALAGSVVAAGFVASFGRRLFGGWSGFFAGCLLVLHPVFWHSGIASALRIQLAIASVAVAAGCWRAWTGERRWVLWSAVLLAVSAGVRPEIGPVLFPLWAASALRAPVTWKDRVYGVAGMAAVVLLWLLPTMFASGGPAAYWRACSGYLADQGAETSVLLGADPGKGATTFWRLLVWTCCGVLPWTLAAVLAWTRGRRWGFERDKLSFLALWFLPPFVFSLLVHVQDPGQTLAMAPPIAIAGGYLFERALANLDSRISRWQTVILIGASLATAWLLEFRDKPDVVVWLPLVGLAAGLLLKVDAVPNRGSLPRAVSIALLLAPVVILDPMLFQFEGWYYQARATTGLAGVRDRALAAVNSGLALTSLSHIKNTLAVDDHSLQQVLRLAAERPRRTVVVWEQGLVTWRKAAYYAPAVPIVVLEHQTLQSGSQPAVSVWNGPRMTHREQSPAPVDAELPAASRIVWLLNPSTDFFRTVSRAFPLTSSGPAWYTDLPPGSGCVTLGEYRLSW